MRMTLWSLEISAMMTMWTIYFDTICKPIEWCNENNLSMSQRQKKWYLTSEKNNKLPKKVIINNRNVEIVENFKYLGILFDNTFSFDLKDQTVFCKVAQRRHLVFQLGNFNIDKNIITLAYTAFVHSVNQYCLPIHFHFTKKKHQIPIENLDPIRKIHF